MNKFGKITKGAAKGAAGIAKDAGRVAVVSLLGDIVKEILQEGSKDVLASKNEGDILEVGKKIAFDKNTSPTQRLQKEFLKRAIKRELGL